MEKQRILWLDALKGYGSILVVFLHLNPWYPLETHICSFVMFVYFFLSGYLHNYEEKLKVFIVKRIKAILIPFLFWGLCSSVVALFMGDGLLVTLRRFLMINGELCWDAPIWFLPVLFFSEVFYAVIMKIDHSQITSFVVFGIGIVLWVLVGTIVSTLLVNLIPFGIAFYALGDICRRRFETEKQAPIGWRIALIVFLGIISVLFGAILNIRVSYVGGVFGKLYYCIPAAITGTLFYWLLFKYCDWLGSSKFLCTLGKYSLLIMSTQYWFFFAYDIVSQKLFHVSVWKLCSTVKALVLSAVTIALTLLFVFLFKRIFKNCPKVLKLAKYVGIR